MQAGFSSSILYTSPYPSLSLYPPVAVKLCLFQNGQEPQKEGFHAKPFVSKCCLFYFFFLISGDLSTVEIVGIVAGIVFGCISAVAAIAKTVFRIRRH